MRRILSCVLMMTLLLTGCVGRREDSPEQLAAVIRAEYLSVASLNITAEISAAYGEQVFDFTVEANWQREGDTVITVVQPQLLAGITARIREGETLLEYDGAGLSLGALDMSGLTPISALPGLMDCITTGYMARCAWRGEGESRELEVLCRDPNADPGKGTEFTLYFDPATHALLRAEVSVDGVLCLRADMVAFEMELKDNEAGRDQNMG